MAFKNNFVIPKISSHLECFSKFQICHSYQTILQFEALMILYLQACRVLGLTNQKALVYHELSNLLAQIKVGNFFGKN